MPARSFLRRIGYAIGLAPRSRPSPPPEGGRAGGREAARPGVRTGPGGHGHTRVLRVNGAEPEPGNGRKNGGAGVPKEVLRQVRLIEMRTRGMVASLFSGEYQSVFKGQGMEFAEVRE